MADGVTVAVEVAPEPISTVAYRREVVHAAHVDVSVEFEVLAAEEVVVVGL